MKGIVFTFDTTSTSVDKANLQQYVGKYFKVKGTTNVYICSLIVLYADGSVSVANGWDRHWNFSDVVFEVEKYTDETKELD